MADRKSKKDYKGPSNDLGGREAISNPKPHQIPPEKLKSGTLKDRQKVLLSDGKTAIFIRTGHNVAETVARYELYMNSKRGI